MFKEFNFREFIPQLFSCIEVMLDTPKFIKENVLWDGFFKYKWIVFLTGVISVLFSLFVFGDLRDWFGTMGSNEVLTAGMGIDMDALSESVKEEGKNAAFSGGSRYLLIILLEVVIFYFAVRTLSILNNTSIKPSFKDFVNAEKRMIKVMIRNFVKGLIVQLLVLIAFSIIGLKFLTGFVMFFVYAYFLGYAFLDNYNEQFGMSIKESQKVIRKHVGAAASLGVVVSVLLFVPLFGPLLVPIFASIAATIYGERFKMELKPEQVATIQSN